MWSRELLEALLYKAVEPTVHNEQETEGKQDGAIKKCAGRLRVHKNICPRPLCVPEETTDTAHVAWVMTVCEHKRFG